MPKIFVDDFNKGVQTFPKDLDIYPVDYDYCVDYIIDNVEMKKNKNNWSYFCYTCGDVINDISKMSDFEITNLSCGHLHHTSCLLSPDTYNLNAFVEKCVYCNSNAALDIIKKSLETTYYACILAYDMKNPDYVSKLSDFSHLYRNHKKEQYDNEIGNIKFEIKESISNTVVLRRSARLMEKIKSI
jgi:hypothetical protein